MNLFTIFQPYEVTNTYLLHQDGEKNAVIVDPGRFDLNLLKLVEDHNLYISNVLLTHSHINHTRGIPTLMKIYDAQIYSMKSSVLGFKTNLIKEETTFTLPGMQVRAIPVPGHSDDSVIYIIENMLFTGDTLMAGYTGQTAGLSDQKSMTALIRQKIFGLEGEYLLLPGITLPPLPPLLVLLRDFPSLNQKVGVAFQIKVGTLSTCL